jgi:negative regulator of flagellin synthesis FlgM
MKIDPTLKPAAPGAVQDGRPRAVKSDTASRQPGATVELSPLASQLQSIEAGTDSSETVNTSRVAQVKLAIAEGRYQIDAEKIADKLIESTRESLRGAKS